MSHFFPRFGATPAASSLASATPAAFSGSLQVKRIHPSVVNPDVITSSSQAAISATVKKIAEEYHQKFEKKHLEFRQKLGEEYREFHQKLDNEYSKHLKKLEEELCELRQKFENDRQELMKNIEQDLGEIRNCLILKYLQ